ILQSCVITSPLLKDRMRWSKPVHLKSVHLVLEHANPFRRSWSIPFEDTTLKKCAKHYLIGESRYVTNDVLYANFLQLKRTICVR
ncbi:hypothetical protein L9F63_021319, partial [Diploptera punctata]